MVGFIVKASTNPYQVDLQVGSCCWAGVGPHPASWATYLQPGISELPTAQSGPNVEQELLARHLRYLQTEPEALASPLGTCSEGARERGLVRGGTCWLSVQTCKLFNIRAPATTTMS